MLICDTYSVECPEEVVPSSVWLERAKERQNILGKILASPLEGILEFGSAPCKREECLGVRLASGMSNGIRSLIESGPEVVSGIGSNIGERPWQWPSEFNLVELISSIRVGLNNTGVWFGIQKGLEFPLKINDVFLAAIEPAL